MWTQQTAQCGSGLAARQGDVDHATHPSAKPFPPGSSRRPEIAGLTLRGGHGYLTRKYGLTIDNLMEADVVLADGSFMTANETENSDLLWGLRGGGGNFGVVTSFLFRAHPVENGLCRTDLLGPEAMRAEVMRWYRDFLPNAPEDSRFIPRAARRFLSTDPFPREHWNKRMCVLLVSCYNGSAEHGEKAVGADPRGPSSADDQLDGPDAVSVAAEHVRSRSTEGPAMVLEGRLRKGAAR